MIRVIQYNCTRSYKWTILALETGVERRANIVCFPPPPGARGVIGINHSAYDIRTRERVWKVIQKGSGLVIDQSTELSMGATTML